MPLFPFYLKPQLIWLWSPQMPAVLPAWAGTGSTVHRPHLSGLVCSLVSLSSQEDLTYLYVEIHNGNP